MRVVVIVVAMVMGCGGEGRSPAVTPDAAPQPPGPDPACLNGAPIFIVRCLGTTANTSLERATNGAGTHSMCHVTVNNDFATCTACDRDVTLRAGFQFGSLFGLIRAPKVLCAETPEAKVGDTCSTDGTRPCLPTRAQLATDGTVVDQGYLTCDASNTCIATTGPMVASYLARCDAATLANNNTPGIQKVVVAPDGVQACLLAWDANTMTVASGITRRCIGDWDCPSGSLCDDRVACPGCDAWSVCKPGPRGTLTPAMLSP